MNTDTPNPSTTYLKNPRWLTLGRGVWLAVVALSLIIILLAVPIAYNASFDYASNNLHLELAQIGLSPQFYAAFFLVLQIIIAVAYFAAAGVMFWRKSTDWLVLNVALAFATWGPSTGVCGCWLAHEQLVWRLPVFFIQVVGDVTLALTIYLFPDGRFVPRWMRWGMIAFAILVGTRRYIITVTQTPLSAIASSVYFWISITVAIIGLISQMYRYTRFANPIQRQQSKWIIGGGTIIISAWLIEFALDAILAPGLAGVTLLMYWLSGFLFFNFIPTLMMIVAFVFSMLRYRLWDIDFAINRSLVYGTLSLLLLAFFGISLFTISQLFQNFTGGPLTAVAVSALAFGAIFQPARRNLQFFVDQRFYNIQIDYQKTPLPVAPVSSQTKNTFGPYSEMELIARGGMGEVYKAHHPTLNRRVAIKILPTALAAESDFRKRFEREAKTANSLSHPNIVQVFESGELNGTAYMVMEYLGGQDLAACLRERIRFPLSDALPIIRGVAAALDYAHAQGLVHRDIKPSNVMLDGSRTVLTDFGIAKLLGGHTAMTRTGSVLGTFDYIAPEQIQASANVDGRADVYALGVMVYQMCCGELPFKHSNPGALLIAHLTQPPPDPHDLAPDLSVDAAHAIRRAMAKNPEERFATAGEFVTALS